MAKKAKDAARKLFPDENWEQRGENIFVGKRRKPKNKTQEKIFEDDMRVARILAERGHVVYMLPEPNDGKKHCDAIVDGTPTEFKRVTGRIKKVGVRFNEAKKQAVDVFLKIDSNLSEKEIWRKIKGEIEFHNYSGGKIYVWIEGVLREKNTDDIK